MGRFAHLGGLARAGAHRLRVALPVLAGLVLLAGAGCSAGPIWVGTAGGGGTSLTPGSPGAASPAAAGRAGTPAPGRGHGGRTAGGLAGSTGGSGTGPGGSPGSAPGGPSGVTPGGRSGRAVLFGGDVPLTREEPRLGRRLAIVRVYDLIGQRFPDRREAAFMSQGSTVLVSFDTIPRHGPSYAAIAAGRADGAIRAFLDSVEQAAVRYRLGAIYVTFEHEANNVSKHAGLGSPAEFVRAWDHVHRLAVDAQLDWDQGGRLHWVLILTHRGYLNGSAASYWPGTGEVDIIAADGYNTGGCRHPGHGQDPPVSPASLFSAAVSFAVAHGRIPVFIAEWGSVAYPAPGVRVSFIRQMQAFVDANPLIAAALYWDSEVPHCNYELNNSASSLAALASMGRAADMQGR